MKGPRDWFGVRATLLLPTLVAVLSFATGVANISAATVSGPLAPYLPTAVERTVGFTGTLTGFLLLSSVYGLRRRLRAAWYATILLLPLTAVQGLLQPSVAVPGVGQPLPVSAPLVVLSIVSLPTVLMNRRLFDRRWDVSTTQLAAIAALAGGQIYITVGSYALRESFGGIETLTDALYFAVVTSSTVGYGDIAAQSQSARLFATSAVVIGTASFALALGSVLGPAIQSRITRALGTMTETQLDLLEDHLLVLGYGDLTEPIIDELADVEFVVVTDSQERASRLQSRDIPVLTDDPSDEEPQLRAGIERARAVVTATNDDAQDALAILTARQLNPEVRVVAAATDRENVEKLRRAGADSVISPAVIGSHLLVQSALGEDDSESIADRILRE
ncbi:NAD-binding protein [Halomicrobium urmianum]|uniref:NAD-binding protein n=1 Tax=Halomicrobium urmianum TaxID=1586233 RepID=UPI001CD95EA4|nr:NAD-binding protein [Halomicrobium urmianum]